MTTGPACAAPSDGSNPEALCQAPCPVSAYRARTILQLAPGWERLLLSKSTGRGRNEAGRGELPVPSSDRPRLRPGVNYARRWTKLLVLVEEGLRVTRQGGCSEGSLQRVFVTEKKSFHNNLQNHVKDLELVLATHSGCPQVSSAAFPTHAGAASCAHSGSGPSQGPRGKHIPKNSLFFPLSTENSACPQ